MSSRLILDLTGFKIRRLVDVASDNFRSISETEKDVGTQYNGMPISYDVSTKFMKPNIQVD